MINGSSCVCSQRHSLRVGEVHELSRVLSNTEPHLNIDDVFFFLSSVPRFNRSTIIIITINNNTPTRGAVGR